MTTTAARIPTRDDVHAALTGLAQAYMLSTTFRAQNLIVAAAARLTGRHTIDAGSRSLFEELSAAAWQLVVEPAPSDVDPELGSSQADAERAHEILEQRVADALVAFGA